jgi:N-acetylated-alpha-linked acidic dipeptidase
MRARAAVALAFCLGALLATASRQPAPAPLGFSRTRAAAYTSLEGRLLSLPSADRIRQAHMFLSGKPHLAGSVRDRELAEWMRDLFRECGLEEVAVTTHDVLLPWPEDVSIEMLAPRVWKATMREDPVPEDSDAQAPAGEIGIAYHAFSASGSVTAPVVYAGRGSAADYGWLTAQRIDVRGKIVLVRHSTPYSYRGFKAFNAQQRGAAGILIYSDPADDGYAKGKVYPDGPWGPESRIERGGIAYDFLVPGDPLTPGWASTPGARRLQISEAVSLPRIISAPLSHKDARTILEALGGPEVPPQWRGALPITYRAGPGATVRLRVRTDDRIRPIWTVTGMIRGGEYPDDVVIVGNHRDAWAYGGVDPSSGSAAIVELVRVLGELKRTGWRPKRSILFASWDAEEFSLTSSTEWGEQHERWLHGNAVVYLNVDKAASGQDLALSAVPALNPLLEDAARIVRDPATGLTLAARTRDRAARERGRVATGSAEDIVQNRLGSGSDYTVFLNFLGVPVADFSFEGPYGVYHSAYDTHNWVAKIGDPGFRYHAALVQLLGVVALRLADSDIIPLDYEPYARRLEEFERDASRTWRASQPSHDPLDDVRKSIVEFRQAASRFNARRAAALAHPAGRGLERLNRQLVSVERALLDPAGLPGRRWFRHLIYAPKFSYAPEVLPGVAEAVAAGDWTRARDAAQRLREALRRAAAALEDE